MIFYFELSSPLSLRLSTYSIDYAGFGYTKYVTS